MIQLSRMADYGILVLTALAKRAEGGPSSANALAEATTLPMPTVSQILKTLNKAGLVAARRGAHGGYLLHQQPTDISLRQIIEAIDGPIALTHCLRPNDEPCDLAAVCGMRPELAQVNTDIREALEKVKLDHLKGVHVNHA